MLSIISCACWPLVYPPWRNVYLVLLPIFSSDCFLLLLSSLYFLDINVLVTQGSQHVLPFRRPSFRLVFLMCLCRSSGVGCIPLVNICCCPSFWRHIYIKKITAKHSIRELLPRVPPGVWWYQVLCLSAGLFWVNFSECVRKGPLSLFCTCFSNLPSRLLELFCRVLLAPLSDVNGTYTPGFSFGLSILSHWSMCLLVCLCHTVFMTVTL